MRQHRIKARLIGPLPRVPEKLKSVLLIRHENDRVQIETPGELSAVLSWLAEANLEDMYVQPIGLRAVYDRFHHSSLVATTVNEAVK